MSRVLSMRLGLLLIGAALLFTTGCGASLAQPFDQMQQAPITVYRLQNYVPPAQQATTGTAAVGGITLPPQIQSWVTAGASLLPPGLLPPGLLPGTAPAAVAQTAPQFHNFPILGSANITDSKIHDEVLSIFGTKGNWTVPKEGCLYAEFGFSIGQINQPPADILVSLSCGQVSTSGFAWPFGANTGLSADTDKKLIAVIRSVFGGGAG